MNVASRMGPLNPMNLDRLDDYPLPDGPTYEIHKNWKPPK